MSLILTAKTFNGLVLVTCKLILVRRIMTTEQAWKIVGNQNKTHIRMMVKALSMMSAINTAEENRRLEAGKICLRTNNPRFS